MDLLAALFILVDHLLDPAVLMVVGVSCWEEQVEFVRILLVDSEDQVDPFVDIVAHVFRLKLLTHDARQVVRVCCVRWHSHAIDEKLTSNVADLLFLSKPSVVPVPVLIELRQEEELWNELSVATVGADSVIEALKAELGPIRIFGRIAEDEGTRIRLKPLQKEHVCEEGRVAYSILKSIRSKQLPVHEVHLVAFDSLILHRLQSTLVAILNLIFALLVENGGYFAKVSVDLIARFRLFKRVQVTFVVSEDPREDWVRTQVVEASRTELVQLKEQLLVLNLALEPWVEHI